MRQAGVIGLVIVVAACNRGGTKVNAPEPTRDFGADSAASVTALPDPPAGTIVAPLALDFEAAAQALEQEVPRKFGDITKRTLIPGSKRKSFAFEVLREPFKVVFAGDTVLLSSVLHYKGRGWYDPPIGPDINGECGTKGPPPRARLTLRVLPRLAPDWHLVVRTRAVHVVPLTATERDQCEVSFLNLDVTGKVMTAAEGALRSVLPQVERKLAKLDVRSPLEKIWVGLQQPIKITDSLWLLLTPRGVHLGQVRGGKETVGAEIGVTAAPRLLTGPKPVIASVPLPLLGPVEKDEGFSMLIEGLFDYGVMSSVLTEKLRKMTVRAAGGEIKIKKVTVFGVGHGRLAMGIDFTGTASGKVWFEGTPNYEPTTGIINVPDLDFDASSADLLVQGVAWLKGDAIRTTLREQAEVSTGDLLTKVQAMAMKEMNREVARGVHLSVTIERSDPAGVVVGPNGILIRAHALGSARLDLGPELFKGR